jgi:hypothetical protein
MKMPVALWTVILSLSTACHDEPPTGPDTHAGDSPAADVRASGIRQVSVGDYHACSLDAAGVIACWGSDRYGQASPVDGRYVQVSAGEEHTCALERGGSIVCWGKNSWGESAPPKGSFTQVSAAWRLSCGLRPDGTVDCWGYGDLEDRTIVPEGRYVQVTAADDYVCALRRDATAVCWGFHPGWHRSQPEGRFSQIEAGSGPLCGLRPDGTLTCWNGREYSTPLDGVYTQVSVGSGHSCAIAADSTVACWGNDDAGQATPPAGKFTQVSAGWRYTCGVRSDGTAVCWGEVPAYVPPAVTLEPVATRGSGTITDDSSNVLHFSFHVTLDPDEGPAPTGMVRFRVPDAGFALESTAFHTAEVRGDTVVIRGIGTGLLGTYEREVGFIIIAVDGGTGGVDAFRAQLLTDEFNALEYDSWTRSYDQTATTPLDNGTVTIRTDLK